MSTDHPPSVQVALPPDLERFVTAKVASGEYPAPALVIHAALQELRARGMTETDCRTELEADIVTGIESGPCMQVTDEFWRDRRRELGKRIARAKPARTGDLLLPRKLDDVVNAQITSGSYETPTDVVCEALRLLDKPFRFADETTTERPGP